MWDSASPFLQVRFQNRLVGWLNNFDAEKAPELIDIDIATPTFTLEDRVSEDAIERRVFAVKTCSFAIDRFSKERMGAAYYPAYLKKLVPPYAQIFTRPLLASTVYEWRAVRIEEYDDYEFIFNYGCFIPIDTIPDDELRDFHPGAVTHAWIDETTIVSDEVWNKSGILNFDGDT